MSTYNKDTSPTARRLRGEKSDFEIYCDEHPIDNQDWKEEFDNLIDKLPTRVSETPKEVIISFIENLLSQQRKEIINELESNPNEDGSISPNIQHWIESKQRQLRLSIIKGE